MSTTENVFKSRKAVLERIVDEAPGVKTLVLRVEGDYWAEPGQFNTLYHWGVGEVPISISGLPICVNGHTLIEHTVRAAGAVTRGLIYRTPNLLGLRGPYGRGWPLRGFEGLNVLVVAGGLGMAPLRPLVKLVLERREDFGEILVLYGVRSPEHLLFKYELPYLQSKAGVKLLLSSDTHVDGWAHYYGPVTDLLNLVQLDPSKTVAYVCGPEVMMKTAVKKLLGKGFRADRVFVSLERRMRCGVGVCGTCQLGHYFVCKDGPVFSYEELVDYFWVEGI